MMHQADNVETAGSGHKGIHKLSCKSTTIEHIREHGHVLTPGRYVGAEAVEDDGESFEDKLARLTSALAEQQAEAARLDAAIRANLETFGYGFPKSRTLAALRDALLPKLISGELRVPDAEATMKEVQA
jgi:hypothetical protein